MTCKGKTIDSKMKSLICYKYEEELSFGQLSSHEMIRIIHLDDEKFVSPMSKENLFLPYNSEEIRKMHKITISMLSLRIDTGHIWNYGIIKPSNLMLILRNHMS